MLRSTFVELCRATHLSCTGHCPVLRIESTRRSPLSDSPNQAKQ
ncbi:MAG: hypothetical protein KDB27_25595 [Planctomycetales bacterium]|nr:hypothetical protein [Planctomycetales bacterium]